MNITRLFQKLLYVSAALVTLAIASFAQSDLGLISGFVKDPSGSSIPNAKISLRNQSGLERETTSNESGFYTVTNIPPGLYTLTVEASGFKRFESRDNKLDPSSNLELNADLTVGAASDTVEVTATAVALQTESAAVQSMVTRKQIDSLELNGRNPVNLSQLVPGARGGNLSGLNFSFGQGPSNFNGSRNPENLITYDGAPATRTRSNGTSLGSADTDATQEVQILTADYAPEYGRSSGAQIRIVSKSGTSDFHGAAYDYVRNAAFNANTWTRNHIPGQDFVPVFNYNDYGYNGGGPVYIPGKFNRDKNKIFFYWGQDWIRYRFADSATWTVPTDLMRQGNFSELLTSNNILQKAVIINDPSTGNPYPGNIIPAAQLSQNGLGILKAYPKANQAVPIGGTGNFYVTAVHPQDQRKDTLTTDFNLTQSQRLSFRRLNYKFNEYQPLDGTPTETPKYFNRPNQTNSLSYVWTASPTIVNEVLATVSLDDVYIPVDTAHFFDRTTAGINYPYIFPQGKLIPTRIPTANIQGLNGLNGGPYPSHSSGPIYTLSDSLTWVRGRHTIKFGFAFERAGENDNDEINVNACPTCTNNQNGQFSFTDNRSNRPSTGNAIANTALGIFDSYSELGQRAYTPFRSQMYEGFVQDSWKANQKLTVNYGARYTVIVPYYALWGNMIVFDPTLYNPATAVSVDPKTGAVIPGSGDRYDGMVIPGSGWPSAGNGRFPESTSGTYDYLFRNGVRPNHYSDVRFDQIQPRAGIAYQWNPRTVLRAGAGRFYTRLGVSDSIFLGGNPPFQPTANVSFGSADNPGGTSANSLPLTVTAQSGAFRNPEAWNYNFIVEREFYWNSVLSVGYVGRRGIHLQRESNINQPTAEVVAANPGVNIDALRPYKGYNSIRETDNVASSRYNSLQATWNRRFSQGIFIQASYTYGKSMDDGSNQRDIIPDTYNAHNLWAPSDFDVRSIFIASFLYDLPFLKTGHGWLSTIVGGWQVSGLTQWQTGTPTSIAKGNDYVGVGQDGSLSGGGQYWMHSKSVSYGKDIAVKDNNAATYWFNPFNADGTPIFTAPQGAFNLQSDVRNNIYNPGFNNTNLGLFKSFSIRETIGFQFRAEAFDVFNHPNWNGPNTDPTNKLLGKITGKSNDVRNLQLSLRFYF